jgi:hypothetical protein
VGKKKIKHAVDRKKIDESLKWERPYKVIYIKLQIDFISNVIYAMAHTLPFHLSCAPSGCLYTTSAGIEQNHYSLASTAGHPCCHGAFRLQASVLPVLPFTGFIAATQLEWAPLRPG